MSNTGESFPITRPRRVRRAACADLSTGAAAAAATRALVADPYRNIVFPNAIRDVRLAKGHLKLLPFSARLPDIPYVRLSKIERGEVFARADELIRIATALNVTPASLLIDVASPGFDIAAWYAPFAEGAAIDDPGEARMALLLAAAVRRARAADPQLTAAVVNDLFGIAPVILSRIENAQKGLSRWSPDIIAAVDKLLGERDVSALRRWLEERHASGDLEPFLTDIIGPDDRRQRMRQRIAALAIELEHVVVPGGDSAIASSLPPAGGTSRRIALLGAPDADGTIALVATGETIAMAGDFGARAYAIRVARATLGPGLPAGTVVVVDPDRYPRAGGLALVRAGELYRLVSVIADRTGALVGHSVYPDREIDIDALDTGDVAAITAAFFA